MDLLLPAVGVLLMGFFGCFEGSQGRAAMRVSGLCLKVLDSWHEGL